MLLLFKKGHPSTSVEHHVQMQEYIPMTSSISRRINIFWMPITNQTLLFLTPPFVSPLQVGQTYRNRIYTHSLIRKLRVRFCQVYIFYNFGVVKMAEQRAELRAINIYPIQGRKYKCSINYGSLQKNSYTTERYQYTAN